MSVQFGFRVSGTVLEILRQGDVQVCKKDVDGNKDEKGRGRIDRDEGINNEDANVPKTLAIAIWTFTRLIPWRQCGLETRKCLKRIGDDTWVYIEKRVMDPNG